MIKSAFRVFPHAFQLYQGVANNFMFADAIGAQAILWEEARFNSQQQEAYKLLMEGADMSIAVKGTKNDILCRTPVGITCNQLPWVTMTHVEDENAFKNRSYIFNMASAPWLKVYEKKGDIDPRAWLCLDTDHWETVLTSSQLQTRESILRLMYADNLPTPPPQITVNIEPDDTRRDLNKEFVIEHPIELDCPIEDDDDEQIITQGLDYEQQPLNTPHPES